MQPDSVPNGTEQQVPSFEFKSVLLVDDDRQLLSALQWILADQNFLVDAAYDGKEALDKIRQYDYDAIVCDVVMPRLRGNEFYTQAVQLRPKLADRFIFITGYAADTQVNLFLCKVGCKYLMKPFPVQKLIDCLNQLLA